MDTISKIILVNIPFTHCNLKCRYCYLSQRPAPTHVKFEYQYSPEHVAKAFSPERLGGPCYFNFCASGETLLAKDIDQHIYEIVKLGHYVEIVTNMTVTPVIQKILSWEPEILSRITFKCSFHYLQLVERGLLETFAQNVNSVWSHNCSANVEITPDDELIPYIPEVMAFSMKHFGALPHLSIARDDRTGHDYLTELSHEEYIKTWSVFDSDMWKFKLTTFNVKRDEYCYAGAWSLYVNLSTGYTTQCYCSKYSQNIFSDPEQSIDWISIDHCPDTHCYNSHMLLTLGLIPYLTDIGYGNIRDREKSDGTHWIMPEMKEFLNSKLCQANPEFSSKQKKNNLAFLRKHNPRNPIKYIVRKVLGDKLTEKIKKAMHK